jgi:tetratricopeptide (TPR) repeat protein
VRTVRTINDPVLEARVRLKAASCQSQLGHLTEARRMLDTALRKLDRRHSSVRAEALYGLAVVAWQSGELDRTLAYSERALHHYQRAGTRTGMAAAMGMLGDVARHQGELDVAEDHFRECLRLLEATGAAGHHIAVSNLAMVLLDKGDLDEAHGLLEDALARSDAGAHATASAMIRMGLLLCEARMGQWSRWSERFGGMQLLLDGTLTTADVAYDARRVARLASQANQRTCSDALWSLAVEQFRALGRDHDAEAAQAEWVQGRS